MRPMLASLSMVVLLGGCDRSTLSPTPLSPAQPIAPGSTLPQTYTVSGLVKTSGNVPVAGARIVALGQEPSAATITDGNGYYSISGVSASSLDGLSPLLSASKPGYFTDVEFARGDYAAISKDSQRDFELDPWVKITVGETVRGQAPIGDADCSHWGYGASACQRFALTVSSSGTLEVTLSAPIYNFDFDIVKPDGTFAMYSSTWQSPLRATIPVEAGSTYELRVIGGWSPARDFELSTALR
jgi:hypothetical protein